jgi:signal transduction histidine kinase
VARYFYLTPVLGGPGAPRYPITSERQLVGRSEGSNIALLEPTVSREHAAVYCVEETVQLEDLDSKHGTYVNSKRVAEKTLKVGDIVVFGLSLVLRLEETDQPLPPAPALAASGPDATVSLVDPPRRRRETDRNDDPTVTRAAPAPSDSELDRMREATVRSRKLATVGAQASAVLPDTHRLLSELRDALARGESAAELIPQLETQVERVGQLLDDCRIARPRLEPVNLFDVTRRAVAAELPQANRRDVDLLNGVPATIEVFSDPSRLRAALVQLIRNAAEASPRGAAVELGAAADDRYATLTVTDSGEGIPADQLERVFDPFVTLREDWRSIGMGLFEAREVISVLGGTLRLESVSGQGTTATVTLPLA